MRTKTHRHYRRDLDSVFSLLGETENAITMSIAWTLSQCPTFLAVLLSSLGPRIKAGDLQVATQSYGRDRGFTDIELYETGRLHIIAEAKRGWWLPDQAQFKRYLPRFKQTQAPLNARFLLSMSEASETYAGLYLPPRIDGVPVKHISWHGVLKQVAKSRQTSRSLDEKRWLGQLSLFLGEIASMQNQRSNEVYVVSLSREEVIPKTGYTWIDIVAKDGRYFHPVGDSGWPVEPPNYIGFRYDGRLKSVHHIQSYEVVRNLHERNKNWLKTDIPHFVYKLGKPMQPAKEIRTGNIYRNGRVWCLIDTLLSGEFSTIAEARDASRHRLAKADQQ